MNHRPTNSDRWVRPVALTILLLLGALAGIMPAAANRIWAATAPPQALNDDILVPDPAIHFGRLANGFRYILMPNGRPEHRVSLHLVIDAGSLDETEAQQGVAHFLEHMMFNGTAHFAPDELVRYFQHIGMQFGSDANAHTGFNQTVYDVILPDGGQQTLMDGLLVMFDYATGASLLEAEIKRESGVILAEMRSRDSAGYRTFKATLGFELPDFLASRRLPIGKAAVIRSADRELLKSFYDAWYRPDNMVLVMVGDVAVADAEPLIRKRFGDFGPRAVRPPRPSLGSIDHRGLNVFYHHEPEVGGTTVSIETIAYTETPVDSAAVRGREMMREMADRIVQNRLDARLKAPEAPFTAATIGSGIYLGHVRYSEISADCSPEKWSETLAAVEKELRRALRFGFTDDELARVKKDMLTMLDNAVSEAPTRNSTALAQAIIRDLKEARATLSPDQERTLLAPLVASATLEAVETAFRRNWTDRHRLVLVSGNADLSERSAKPAEAQIRNAFLAAAATAVRPPAAVAVKPFPYLPVPADTGTIASREVLADLGVTRVRLGNGIRINLKQTDFKANEVLANLVFGNGRSDEPEHLPGIGLLTEATMNESGLGGMDTDELERALAGKSTYTDLRVSDTAFNLFGESVSGELELLFQLIHAHLTDPGFRDEALILARERLRQDYLSATRSIEGMMKIAGTHLLAGGDSRFGMPPFEAIERIDLEDIRQWIAPPLTHAPLELSIVGDIDENAAVELARRYLGALPARDATYPPSRRDRPSLPAERVSRIAVDTQIPKALVVAAWQTDDFWNIGRTRRLSVLADIFSERLRVRIREKLGASYSPYAYSRPSRAYPGYGVLQVHVNVAPDQTAAVLDEVRGIAAHLAHDGITADELSRSVDPILTGIREFRQTNGYWLNSVMTGSQRHPEQFDWARTFVDDYRAITPAELSDLARTYLVDRRAAAIIIAPQTYPADLSEQGVSSGS